MKLASLQFQWLHSPHLKNQDRIQSKYFIFFLLVTTKMEFTMHLFVKSTNIIDINSGKAHSLCKWKEKFEFVSVDCLMGR